MVNHLLEYDFWSDVQLQSILQDLDRVPLAENAPIFNENPPIVGKPQDSGTRRTLCGVARPALMEKGREFESAFGARP